MIHHLHFQRNINCAHDYITAHFCVQSFSMLMRLLSFIGPTFHFIKLLIKLHLPFSLLVCSKGLYFI